MSLWRFASRYLRSACAVLILAPGAAAAADIHVPRGGNLQTALNTARPGDTVLLEPGAVYVGNFVLPVHGGTTYVTVRTADPAGLLPPAGTRIGPAHAPYLAKIQSPNNGAAIRTAANAAFWRLLLLEIPPTPVATGTGLELGDGSAAQYSLDQVPHHLIVDRVYVHGDVRMGQKRGIGLNSATTTLVNSYVSEIKMAGQDSQALAAWNGPGPYRIENNYFEGAANGILIGGDDPKIAQLTPSDILFRNNTVSRPVSWRNPILATPADVRATFTSDGALPAGTYAYRVVARRWIAGTPVKSAAAVQAAVTVTAGARVTVEWSPVPDAVDYMVYGRTPGAQNRYWIVAGTSFSDAGSSVGSAGAPTAGTVWQVKNQFELKNARRVQVDFNIIENNWVQAQNGVAILFTPRNQYGDCTWCVVEDVVFERNVVRGIASAFNILGVDYRHPSQQTNNISIRNNLITDLSKSWGNGAYFLYLTGGARDIEIDHNTIISDTGAGIINVDGAPVHGFVLTNNVARHNTYGIIGTGRAPGQATIDFYFPGAVIARNVFAGGRQSSYPLGNLFPTIAGFQAHFVDYAGNDYALVPGTDWAYAGTDGKDLGAEIQSFREDEHNHHAEPPTVATVSVPETTEGEAYATQVLASGGTRPYLWDIAAGALPAGIVLDPLSGLLSGTAQVVGDATFSIRVTDATGATAQQPLTLRVNRAVPPVQILTPELASVNATVPFSQALHATGGLGSYRWTVVTGLLPAGVTLRTDGVLTGTAAEAGIAEVTVTAVDAADATRYASRAFVLSVGPAPNVAPTVALTAPGTSAVVPVGAPITLAAAASDTDGTVQRVDFYVAESLIGSATTPGFTLPWLVPAPGSYTFHAVAVDDRGATARSSAAVVSTKSEIVLYASHVTRLAGNYQLVPDVNAAGGYALLNADKVAPKVGSPAVAPASYAEFTFHAEAGRPYHLWVRGRADRNQYANDSAFVQFDGVAGARIGTTTGRGVNLEDGPNVGLSGYGWQDDGYGVGVLGSPIFFERTGLQTMRIQPREDGLRIDQIVISPERFLHVSPGALKNDTTIVAP